MKKFKKVLSWGFIIFAGVIIIGLLLHQHIENNQYNKRIEMERQAKIEKQKIYDQTPEGIIGKAEREISRKKAKIRSSAHKYFGISKSGSSGLRGFDYADGECSIEYRFYPFGFLKYEAELGSDLSVPIKKMFIEHSEIKNFIIKISSPFKDSYGKTTWKSAGSFEFPRSLYNRINWEDFDNSNLLKIVGNKKGF